MTNRYKILQRKLKELESELVQVVTLPSDIAVHQLLADGVNHRFLFLKNLFSAEINASHTPSSKPRHLHHLQDRLEQLENAFREWDAYRNSNSGGTDNVRVPNDDVSVCSCTESCLNDDGFDVEQEVGSPVVSESSVYEVPEMFYEVPVAGDEKVVMEETVYEREKGRVGMWRWCRVMAVGAMVCATLMVQFWGCFYDVEYETFLAPT